MLTIQKTNRIPAIMAHFQGAVDRAVKDTKIAVAEDAKSRAPVESGELRDGIVVTAEGVESNAPHSLFIEIGTEKTSPQPFLTPAVESAEANMILAIKQALK